MTTLLVCWRRLDPMLLLCLGSYFPARVTVFDFHNEASDFHHAAVSVIHTLASWTHTLESYQMNLVCDHIWWNLQHQYGDHYNETVELSTATL